MKTRILGFDVVVVKDSDGGYYAYVPQLPGCYTQGETVEETLENIKEAIELYLVPLYLGNLRGITSTSPKEVKKR